MVNTVNYFVIAEDVIRGDDGSITLVRVFNTLLTEKLPVTKPKITLAFGFFPPEEVRKKGVATVKLEVVDPSGNNIAELTAVGKLKKTVSKHKLVPELSSTVDLSDGLLLPEFGIYNIKLWCEATLIAENKFEVAKK